MSVGAHYMISQKTAEAPLFRFKNFLTANPTGYLGRQELPLRVELTHMSRRRGTSAI
jgi:hypothetical protein